MCKKAITHEEFKKMVKERVENGLCNLDCDNCPTEKWNKCQESVYNIVK